MRLLCSSHSAHLLLCLHNCEMNLPTINFKRFVFRFNCFTSSRDIRTRQWIEGINLGGCFDSFSRSRGKLRTKKTWIEILDSSIGFNLWFYLEELAVVDDKPPSRGQTANQPPNATTKLLEKLKWNGILWWCEWFIYVRREMFDCHRMANGKVLFFVRESKFQINVAEWVVRNGSHSSIFTKV